MLAPWYYVRVHVFPICMVMFKHSNYYNSWQCWWTVIINHPALLCCLILYICSCIYHTPLNVVTKDFRNNCHNGDRNLCKQYVFTKVLCYIRITHHLLEYYCMINLHEHKYLGLDDLICSTSDLTVCSMLPQASDQADVGAQQENVYKQYWYGAM